MNLVYEYVKHWANKMLAEEEGDKDRVDTLYCILDDIYDKMTGEEGMLVSKHLYGLMVLAENEEARLKAARP